MAKTVKATVTDVATPEVVTTSVYPSQLSMFAGHDDEEAFEGFDATTRTFPVPAPQALKRSAPEVPEVDRQMTLAEANALHLSRMAEFKRQSDSAYNTAIKALEDRFKTKGPTVAGPNTVHTQPASHK